MSQEKVLIRELWNSPGILLLFDPATGLLRLVRSAVRVQVEHMDGFRLQLPTLLGGLRPILKGLIIDVRQAVGRNDDAFEQASSHLLLDLATWVPRIAVLVTTTVGMLQVQRSQRVNAIPQRGFQDEAAAIKYLLERNH